MRQGGKMLIAGLMAMAVAMPCHAQVGVTRSESGSDGDGATTRLESIGLDEVGVCAPVALPWAIKICGGATRSGWGRMATSQAMGGVIALSAMLVTKHTAHCKRPDGSDDKSFFSGHSTIAFAGATMATRELAWRSPWYSVGSYAVASAVGMQRVMSRRHYPVDVMTGAVVGIASAQLGYIIGDAIFGARNMDKNYRPSDAGAATTGPNLTLTTGLVFPIGRNVTLGDGRTLNRHIALRTAIDGSWAADEHWEIGGGVALTAMPVSLHGEPTVDEQMPRPMNEIELKVAPGYSRAVGQRVLLTARVGGGYAWRMHLHSMGGVQPTTGGAFGMAEVSASMPMTERLSFGLTASYRVGSYGFTAPWADESVKGTDHRIGIGLTTRVNF